MKAAALLILIAVAFVGSLGFSERLRSGGYIKTPVGLVPEKCVHIVKSGARIVPVETGALAVFNDPESNVVSQEIPPCDWKGPISQSTQQYDGWLAYTSWNYSSGITQYLGNFSVPTAPSQEPEVLYIFTGLQNVNWIPIIDPEPPTFDIIQPVLQYPGDNGAYWSVKSWYVTLTHGVSVTKELKLDVGDVVFGNMTQTGAQSWYIGSTSVQTGKSVGLQVDHPVLKLQPWAYTTVECYGCNGCLTAPKQPVYFTDLALFSESTVLEPDWEAHQRPTPICNTKANIVSPSAVTMTFGTS